MMELVDMLVLETSSGAIEGSSPSTITKRCYFIQKKLSLKPYSVEKELNVLLAPLSLAPL